MMARRKTPKAPPPKDTADIRAARVMKAAMDDPITRDLTKHAAEKCIRAVHSAQELADSRAAQILIALECAAALLLYESANLKHLAKLQIPLADVLNQLTHDMLAMIPPETLERGEKLLLGGKND